MADGSRFLAEIEAALMNLMERKEQGLSKMVSFAYYRFNVNKEIKLKVSYRL